MTTTPPLETVVWEVTFPSYYLDDLHPGEQNYTLLFENEIEARAFVEKCLNTSKRAYYKIKDCITKRTVAKSIPHAVQIMKTESYFGFRTAIQDFAIECEEVILKKIKAENP